MKIVTANEMREIDRRTADDAGVQSLTLMENAGAAVAHFCSEQFPDAARVGVICGKGNNGGDGLVAARKLHEAGREVRVLLLADRSDVKGDAAEMLARVPVEVVAARNEDELNNVLAQAVFKSDLLLDAILGTGFQPPVSALYAAAIQRLWRAEAPLVSVDLPSGVNADLFTPHHDESRRDSLCGRADAVVTFTAPKPSHVFHALTPGPVVVAWIGTPRELIASTLGLEVIARDTTSFLNLPRAPEAHKGDFGHVLVIGGSRGKAGAAAMAGMAALRTGAGLCTVATPRSVQSLVSSFAAELMTEDLAETDAGAISLRALEYGRADAIMRGKTVIAIGPGISHEPEAAEFVRTVVHRRAAPVVLDADGLNAFDGMDERLDGSGVPLVLTPHPGEMARLAGVSTADVQADRIGMARKCARDHNCIVVLKGWRTLVAEPGGTVWVNVTGNPGMATGGSGDILTGMIAGVIAQSAELEGISLLQRVLAAVRLHGLAGDLARDELCEQALLATDLLRHLPAALRRTEWHPGRTAILEGAGSRRLRERA